MAILSIQELLDAAKCFHCIPKGMQSEVQLYLTWVWSGGATPPSACGTPSNLILITGAGVPEVNQTYAPNPLEPEANWIGVADSHYDLVLTVINTWEIRRGLPGPDRYYTTTPELFPCQWAIIGDAAGPAPSGYYLSGACGSVTDNIQIAGAGSAGANQVYSSTGVGAWVGQSDPSYTILLVGATYTLSGPGGVELYQSTNASFPCDWTVGVDGSIPVPAGAYIP